MSKTVLVIAAHPDDEILGCGGTIAKHVSRGDTVHVVIMAEGITSRFNASDRSTLENDLASLESIAKKANTMLGVSSVHFEKLPDNRLDSVQRIEVIKRVELMIERTRPEVIYTHHSGDLNIDHRRVHEAVVTATRPIPDQVVKSLLFFEVPSSTEWQSPGSRAAFVPHWFVEISETLAKKLEALNVYECEMRPWPHARSIEAVGHLAKWRGSTVGVNAAEAFMVGRNLE